MKIAVTVWGNRISPVFDSAQTILLAEIQGKKVMDMRYEFIPLTTPSSLANALIDLQIHTLMCGAISQQPALLLEREGILLLPFLSGNAQHVLDLYVREKSIDNCSMPGCSPSHCLKLKGRGSHRRKRKG